MGLRQFIGLVTLIAFALLAVPDVLRAQSQDRTALSDTLFSENIDADIEAIGKRYRNYLRTTGSYQVRGWAHDDKSMLFTRYGNLYKTRRPGKNYHPILDFEKTSIGGPQKALICGEPGFVFSDDTDGDEYNILYMAESRADKPVRLSNTQTRNRTITLSRDMRMVAYSSAAKDSGIWLLQVQSLCGDTKTRTLDSGAARLTLFDFTPDGDRLLTKSLQPDGKYRLAEHDIETGEVSVLLQHERNFRGAFYDATGRYIFFLSSEGQNYIGLIRLDKITGELQNLIPGIPLDIEQLIPTDSRNRFAILFNDKGLDRIVVFDAETLSAITQPSKRSLGVISSAYFSPDGESLAVNLSQPTVPSRAGLYDIRQDKIKMWTGGFSREQVVKTLLPDITDYPTFDVDERTNEKRRVPLLAYRPSDASAASPVPVVIFAHGGPASQSRPSFSRFYHYIVTKLGIAVLRPNIRGSTGYGVEFSRLDQVQKREDSIRDIGALLDWIDKQPELDASRVVIAGGSYGGYVSLASLIRYPGRFRGGISRVGVTDFNTFLKNTEPYRVNNRRLEYGDERDPEIAAFFDRISPLQNVEKIQDPVLITQGGRDPRVPLQQAEDIVDRMREAGIDVSYLLAMNEGHGFTKTSNSTYLYGAQIDFLQKHLLSARP